MAQFTIPGGAPAVVTEHDNERQFRALGNGFLNPVSDPPMVYADSTGMHVKIRPGYLAMVQGSVWGSGDEEFQVPIVNNDGPGTRTDLIVLELDRADYDVEAVAVAGTPGAGTPAVTQQTGASGVYQWVTARVTVAQGAVSIAPGNVTPLQVHLAAPLLAAGADAVVAGNVPPVFLRYHPSDSTLTLHTQGAASGGRLTLYQDSSETELSGVLSGWEQTQPHVVRVRNGIVYLRTGEFKRTGSSIGAGVATRLPGSIPTSMRHPTRQIPLAARAIGGPAIVTVYPANDASGRAGQLWVTSNPGINTASFVNCSATSWVVG